MDFWQQDIRIIPGISDKGKENFKQLNIALLYDLLFHLPISYQDRRLKKITELSVFIGSNKPVLIRGKIIQRNFIQSKRKYWRLVLADGSGKVDILMFNLPFYLTRKLQISTYLECFGALFFSGNKLAMMHPKFSIIDFAKMSETPIIKHYKAVYSIKKPLSQNKVQKAIDYCLNQLKNHPIQNSADLYFKDLPSLSDALYFLHRPQIEQDIENLSQAPEIKRLVVDELMHLLLSSEIARINRSQIKTKPFISNSNLISLSNQLNSALDFDLNNDQKRCIVEVQADLAKDKPMQRLIQGDVGSGKTIVSAFCALSVLNQGYQVALLVPTEVLARQHFENFKNWFKPLGIEVLYLSRSISKKDRELIKLKLESKKSYILIGTHLIFQKTIRFSKLGLVIIDEPQRFGVIQRLNLLEKGHNTHQLLMSATPIPRTLAQSIYADLDISQIREKPKQRKPIKTAIFNRSNQEQLIQRVNHILAKGQQVYWVCPRIEQDDESHLRSVNEVYQNLAKRINYSVGLIHGKLKSDDKNKIIADFQKNKIKLLVATTVIEVGIDCTNASVMVIENANYLGLSTLHQLRGRVARGELNGYCVLVYDEYLSINQKQRLEVLKQTNDGFEIAEYDLKTRGAGDLFGVAQKGTKLWQFFKLPDDQKWLDKAKQISKNWAKNDLKGAMDYLKTRHSEERIVIHQVK